MRRRLSCVNFCFTHTLADQERQHKQRILLNSNVIWKINDMSIDRFFCTHQSNGGEHKNVQGNFSHNNLTQSVKFITTFRMYQLANQHVAFYQNKPPVRENNNHKGLLFIFPEFFTSLMFSNFGSRWWFFISSSTVGLSFFYHIRILSCSIRHLNPKRH